ncbi:Tc toxin subunit A-related protein [Serratia entomophila]|uniref:Tc toxin subunit A-related protein n=1 Tax=Serratia entomophila TaxID=42906 RepID=UPI002184061A|nr:neuraminidase-like domain-containing protein [Serratia entomophila]CAI2504105.1 Salmonella virulence plasmid 28.1kDa A protein [Serratia entomophila]
MYNIDDILEKVNAPRARLSEENDTAVTLTDLFSRSFPEVKKITGDSLSWGEVCYLYSQAQHEQKENRLTESRILARANPLLVNAVRLGIRQAAGSRSYDDWFGSRADRFARPGSVASMFSPAAYLTELYREAKDLHPDTSLFRLDIRRPDLAALALSQNNMDDELSTLSLSNELLYRGIGAAEGLDDDSVRELLAGYRLTGLTPYHWAYEAARQAILVQDPTLMGFSRNPDVAQLMDPASMLAIEADISPELYQILAEEITTDSYEALWSKNFGDMPPSSLLSYDALATFYDLDYDELTSLLSLRLDFSNPNNEYYINSQLSVVTLNESTGLITIHHYLRTLGGDSQQINPELIPYGDGTYLYNFSVVSTISEDSFKLGSLGSNSSNLYSGDYQLQKGVRYSIPVEIDEGKLNDGITIGLSRKGGGYYSTVNFTLIEYDPAIFILKLNKVIRLYKATGMTTAEIYQITNILNNGLTIDHAVLSKIFLVRYLMRHYQLDVARSLILCNGTISDQAFSGETGLFTTLFNTPPLNGQLFSADDTPLDLRSEAPEDAFRLSVLKRAFNISASGLSTLWQLASGDSSAGFSCSADNIAALYRVKLLADIHDLSAGELSMLLSVSPFSGVAAGSLSDNELTQFLYQTTTWLTEQGWTVSDVFLMLTTQYGTLLTPDIENLLASLRNGLSGRELFPETLPGDGAPFIAAAMQLDATDTAKAMLTWADQLKPEGLTLTEFILLVMNAAPNDEQAGQMAGFCQALWQLALIIRSTGLSTRELTLLVSQPGRFRTGWHHLPHDLPALRDITRFHAVVNRSGSHAGEVLTALETGELSSALLARALSQNEQDVTGALAQVRGAGEQDNSVFTSWEEVDQAEQWLDMSETLSITPSGLASLIALKYINVSDDSAPLYSQWQVVSGLLQAGLKSSQSSALHDYLEEGTSSALCAYYLRNLAPNMVSGRDDLFGYLLLDNQVSAKVKTTRIAEAIAGIRLYINRALNGIELSAMAEVRGRQFFTDWDTFNKRYSTWAGVSELVYYPENYLDPTVRIGQTGMMDTLLQSVSQSSINRDTVEDAFKTYLTTFEQIANLNTVSGYHDNASMTQGTTWYVGRSITDQTNWYWRSANHSKIQDSMMPANAWTGWTKINCGMNPWSDLVCSVFFNSRLYVVWVEENQSADTEAESTTTTQQSYTLKLSFRRYDGTWSSPVSFDITGNIAFPETQGMHVTCNPLTEQLYCAFYSVTSKPDFDNAQLISVDNDMTLNVISDIGIFKSVSHEFNTSTEKFINNVFSDPSANYFVSATSLIDDVIHSDFSLLNSKTTSTVFTNEDSSLLTPELHITANVSCFVSTAGIATQSTIEKFVQAGIEFEEINFYAGQAAGGFDGFVGVDVSNSKVYQVGKEAVGVTVKSYSVTGVSGSVELFIDSSNKYFSGILSDKMITALISGSTSKVNYVSSIGSQDFWSVKSLMPALQIYELIDDIILTSGVNGTEIKSWPSAEWYNDKLSLQSGNNLFNTKSLSFTVNTSDIVEDEFDVTFTFTAVDQNNVVLAARTAILTVIRNINNDTSVIALRKNTRGAQYIRFTAGNDVALIRLNTLFARQLVDRANTGIDTILSMETQRLTEPALEEGSDVFMDFSGANALYFWELFYYTPMMVFQRLLQEQHFPEATRWLQYVWNPAGHVVNGVLQNYTWNVRPLEEDTGWNDSPLDSIDPDAIAQYDPMHYKVATFMSYLDLLIARGDAAYRLLERDTLNEARMWYVQALNLLGDEPYISFDADWSALTLGDAASEVTRRDYQEALLAVRRLVPAPETRTANSLTALFLPQQNEVLKGYWQTLAQRLHNLRHNLSIDGQPLSLSVYATPSEPSALQSAVVNSAQGAAALPAAVMPLYSFPVMLENARGMVSLLTGFGNTLLGITERQDAEALAKLLQTQGSELIRQGLRQQDNVLEEIDADIAALEESRRGAQMRFERYKVLYEADVNTGEKQAMDLYLSSSVLSASTAALFLAEAAADMLPNIYGLAVGGSRYGALFKATAIGIQVSSDATRISADKISQSEVYRRRREEWEIQRDSAQSDVAQIDAQLAAMAVRREGAELQKTYLETQQTQAQAQLAFLQSKFNNTALYSWLRGRLSAIYYQFYDLAVSRCLMAQQAWQWDKFETRSFIQPGAWMGANAGLLAGETLMLNLAQMEQAWLTGDERAIEVTRTVCLSEVYTSLAEDAAFSLADKVMELVSNGSGSAGTKSNGLQMDQQQLEATLKLADLGIGNDYPVSLGTMRRIKQISVTLPALVGPYQDVRAVLSYGGSMVMPRGCSALAVSHGMNDSGQFQLDFNDPRYLPFEGLPVDDTGTLTLSFPDADGKQQAMLLSLSDIILHIRYTIIS